MNRNRLPRRVRAEGTQRGEAAKMRSPRRSLGRESRDASAAATPTSAPGPSSGRPGSRVGPSSRQSSQQEHHVDSRLAQDGLFEQITSVAADSPRVEVAEHTIANALNSTLTSMFEDMVREAIRPMQATLRAHEAELARISALLDDGAKPPRSTARHRGRGTEASEGGSEGWREGMSLLEEKLMGEVDDLRDELESQRRRQGADSSSESSAGDGADASQGAGKGLRERMNQLEDRLMDEVGDLRGKLASQRPGRGAGTELRGSPESDISQYGHAVEKEIKQIYTEMQRLEEEVQTLEDEHFAEVGEAAPPALPVRAETHLRASHPPP